MNKGCIPPPTVVHCGISPQGFEEPSGFVAWRGGLFWNVLDPLGGGWIAIDPNMEGRWCASSDRALGIVTFGSS